MASPALYVDPVVRTARGPGVDYWRHQQIALAACAVAAVVYAGFYCVRDARNGIAVDVVETCTRAIAEWFAWAVLAPIAWQAAEHWRLGGRATRQMLLRHAGLAVVLAITQALLFWLLLQLRAQLDIAPVRLLVFVRGDDPRFLAARFDSNLVIYAFIVAIVSASHRAAETAAANRERIEAEHRLLDARLEALRQQLRPHFVLNALNAFLSALVTRQAEAARILNALIRLLARPEMKEQLVTLDEELELVRLYSTIEEARFRDQLRVDWAIDRKVGATPIPPFALQTLFENAIRHGSSPARGPARIRVSAQRDGAATVVRVANHGRIGGGRANGTGIGLANLSARLTLLFGSEAGVRLYETGGRTVARITLPAAA